MEYKQRYARGKPVTDLTCHVLPPESEDRRGTCIRFWPDKEGESDSAYLSYVSLCICDSLWISDCILFAFYFLSISGCYSELSLFIILLQYLLLRSISTMTLLLDELGS